MNKSTKQSYQNKWTTILKEYELVKRNKSKHFKKVEDLCDGYKISRKELHKYYGRWKMSNEDKDSLLPQKRGPKPGSRKILTKEEERVIVKINRKLAIGHKNIFHLLKEKPRLRVHPSAITIYRTLKLYPTPEKKKKIKRYEKQIPGEMIHADCHYLARGTLIGNKKNLMVFGMIDDCTRMCYVELLQSFSAPEVTRAFSRGMKWFDCHGVETEGVMTDNGPEFVSPPNKKSKTEHPFEMLLGIFHLKHYRIKPYRPQTNGKIERFWKTFESEYIRNQTFETVGQIEAALDTYLYDYNYTRRHGAIGDITPFEKLKSVTELVI